MTARRPSLGPAFRVPDAAAQCITSLDILLAALFAYLAVPCVAGLVAALLGLVADSAGRGPLASAAEMLGILFFSGFFAWLTAIVAVPAALVCAGFGIVGWASALIGGALAAQSLIVISGIVGLGEVQPDFSTGAVAGLASMGAVYGLAGWAFLRWRRPAAFVGAPGPGPEN